MENHWTLKREKLEAYDNLRSDETFQLLKELFKEFNECMMTLNIITNEIIESNGRIPLNASLSKDLL